MRWCSPVCFHAILHIETNLYWNIPIQALIKCNFAPIICSSWVLFLLLNIRIILLVLPLLKFYWGLVLYYRFDNAFRVILFLRSSLLFVASIEINIMGNQCHQGSWLEIIWLCVISSQLKMFRDIFDYWLHG